MSLNQIAAVKGQNQLSQISKQKTESQKFSLPQEDGSDQENQIDNYSIPQESVQESTGKNVKNLSQEGGSQHYSVEDFEDNPEMQNIKQDPQPKTDLKSQPGQSSQD